MRPIHECNVALHRPDVFPTPPGLTPALHLGIGAQVLYVIGEDEAQLARAAAGSPGVCNPPNPGDIYPATVARHWGDYVNLVVQLDGARTYWATSRSFHQWAIQEQDPETPASRGLLHAVGGTWCLPEWIVEIREGEGPHSPAEYEIGKFVDTYGLAGVLDVLVRLHGAPNIEQGVARVSARLTGAAGPPEPG